MAPPTPPAPGSTHEASGAEEADVVDEQEEEEEEEEEDDEDEGDEEEPRLKYATLTRNVSALYRNGDAASTFMVAGDKMIVGTHNGNIHVFSLPSFSSLRVYHAHTASISAISISPFPPLPPSLRPDAATKPAADVPPTRKDGSATSTPKGKQQQAPVPNIPSNQIYIATSSIDGNVCIASLVDPRDVQLRNFGRPVQTVALSPEYRSDRSYLSGGQAGALILTTGGQAGKSANATTTGAAAAASGWLGSLGLGANTGTDKVLHSGEGIVSTIRWSLSAKYVAWVNEQGIKIMRSNLHLDAGDAGAEWKRLGHIDRPHRPGWDDMAGVWKARAEWIDRANLENDDDVSAPALPGLSANGSSPRPGAKPSKTEELLVGWGDSAWLIKVFPGLPEGALDQKLGRVEVATIIRFDDCTISGISLYTPSLLLVLAFMERKGSGTDSHKNERDERGKRGRRARQNALEPELRLIDITTKEEIDTDTLSVSRFESLSASDYHLGVLPPVRIPVGLSAKGYLSTLGSGMSTVGSSLYTGVETVGQGVWDATMYGPRMLGANRIFSGSESVRSGMSGPEKAASMSIKERNYFLGWIPGFGSGDKDVREDANAMATAQSMKIFVYSPYDCIVAVRRNLTDRLQWLVETKRYQEAWELVDQHPGAAGLMQETADASPPSSPSKTSSVAKSGAAVPPSSSHARQQATLVEFFTDSASITSASQIASKGPFSAAEKEKRRIGELWLNQLVEASKWAEAGEVAAKVLNTTTRWEHWIWIFVKHHKFDEISSHVPTLELTPPLPSSIFEIILGHYVETDIPRFKDLLEQWPSDLFDIGSITAAIEDRLRATPGSTASEEWRLLQESLAKLFLADGHYKEALRCYIRLQDADTALALIKDHHLVEAIADNIPSFVTLRVSHQQLKSARKDELQELASDPINVLVDEATAGVVEPDEVVEQLQQPAFRLFLFFYLRALWRGEGGESETVKPRVGHSALSTSLVADTGKQLVEQFADTAVELFAEYDQELLMEFLQASTAYTFEKAVKVCEAKHYVEELVHLLSKTGQMKKALFLIIDELQDVSKAIRFAKEQDDPGLWDDLLEYSMSRPRFISGLLAGVGTAINPITLVKRIPSGLEVEGLKGGLRKMIREYDLQDSISAGVARVLSSEVAVGMETLRRGRRKGIKFEVLSLATQPRTTPATGTGLAETASDEKADTRFDRAPGHCASCHQAFHADETETLIAFACGHAYHVSHLLRGPTAAGDVVLLPATSISGDAEDEEVDETRFSRSVGPKVTHARLLKDRVQAVGGCTVCKASRDRAKVVGGE